MSSIKQAPCSKAQECLEQLIYKFCENFAIGLFFIFCSAFVYINLNYL